MPNFSIRTNDSPGLCPGSHRNPDVPALPISLNNEVACMPGSPKRIKRQLRLPIRLNEAVGNIPGSKTKLDMANVTIRNNDGVDNKPGRHMSDIPNRTNEAIPDLPRSPNNKMARL